VDAKQHLESLRSSLNEIFDQSLINRGNIGSSHYYSSCIYDFAQNIASDDERKILETVAAQIESAALISAFGLYRQAFASLRLALEMGLGAVYFSIHRLELNEWQDGKADIKWSQLIDDERGVLSKRFADAFFKGLADESRLQKEAASRVYRKLSEFVHGNYETWRPEGLTLSYQQELDSEYELLCKAVFDIIMFSLCCRYLKSMNAEELDTMSFIEVELGHIAPIREALGGPKDL